MKNNNKRVRGCFDIKKEIYFIAFNLISRLDLNEFYQLLFVLSLAQKKALKNNAN